MENYFKKLKSGFQISGDITYYFSESWGIGLKYNQFNKSGSLPYDIVADLDGDGRTEEGPVSNNLKVIFIGPTFSSRMYSYNKKNVLLFNTSIGYTSYENNGVLIDPFQLKGTTLGLVFDIGYDFKIAKGTRVGVQLSYLTGSLYKMDRKSKYGTESIKFESDEKESLNRFDLSIGIRFGD